MVPPPSSQHHPGVSRVWTKFKDLPAGVIHSYNPLLLDLFKFNAAGEILNNDYRKAFWTRVFDGGWTTNLTVIEPIKIRERRKQEVIIQIGTWSQDLPKPTASGTKRRNDGSPVSPPTQNNRKHIAPALLTLNLAQDDTPTFTPYNSSSRAASWRYVQLFPNYTKPQARSDLMRHWDNNEAALDQVGVAIPNTNAAGARRAAQIAFAENQSLFIQLVLASEVFKDLKTWVLETDEIHIGFQVQHQLMKWMKHLRPNQGHRNSNQKVVSRTVPPSI
ncbi:hypothetical protein QBC43DRAFT_292210 [Cladorrhinum sp. PSN259]|nr:hypothetical protein QBC43DRAFT_292210 [Cladorrhinum sp. PSN259]